MRPQVILLDVEGTTTPVDFVFGVLFPFARAKVRGFIEEHAAESGVQNDLALLSDERKKESVSDAPPYASGGDPIPYLEWLIDVDRKSPALKSLQGKIWQSGYESGALKGDVFPDVPEAFKKWSEEGIKICIYSSGSVLAQKLIFGKSVAGDLAHYITEYFDTAVGAKGEANSYRAIAETLGISPSDILFVSDIVTELDAAKEAGFQTRLSIRPGNKPVQANSYTLITAFDQIL